MSDLSRAPDAPTAEETERHQRASSPSSTKKRRRIPLEQRFWPKVQKTPGCWLWIASLNSEGYGQIHVDGRPRGSHRVSYEMAYGPIPEGLEIDHRCRNRRCVNPGHIRLATRGQNSENHVAHRGTKSGIRGVYAVTYTHGKPWRVAVTHLGKEFRAGSFWTLEEAEKAAIALRLQLHTHNEMDR